MKKLSSYYLGHSDSLYHAHKEFPIGNYNKAYHEFIIFLYFIYKKYIELLFYMMYNIYCREIVANIQTVYPHLYQII